MNQPSIILFAEDVAQQLLHNARELSKEPGIKAFCSALAAELVNIQQCLEKLGDAQNDAAGEHRVLTLLDNLEQLCQVGSLVAHHTSSSECAGDNKTMLYSGQRSVLLPPRGSATPSIVGGDTRPSHESQQRSSRRRKL